MSQYDWALQIANARHTGWDWFLKASDQDSTVTLTGRRGAGWTPYIVLCEDGKMHRGPQELIADLDQYCGPPHWLGNVLDKPNHQ